MNTINKLLEIKCDIDKRFELLIKALEQPKEYEQNTINDFYESTEKMIEDLFMLSCTKLRDFLEEGRLYTVTSVMEVYGEVIRYVLNFAKGGDFQGEH